MKHICPVCGYIGLYGPSDDPCGHGNPEVICPSCGCHFGYTDAVSDPKDLPEERATIRKLWIAEGMPWYGADHEMPVGWKPEEQLKKAGLD